MKIDGFDSRQGLKFQDCGFLICLVGCVGILKCIEIGIGKRWFLIYLYDNWDFENWNLKYIEIRNLTGMVFNLFIGLVGILKYIGIRNLKIRMIFNLFIR